MSTADAVRGMAYRRHLLAQRREILVSPFGRIVLRCVEVGAPSSHRKDCEAWGLVRARGSERPGLLVVESLAALRLSNTALGLRAPRVVRSLGQTERGIVAAILAAVVRQFSDEIALSLCSPGRVRDDLARITVALEAGRYREHVHLHVPPHWIPLDENPDVTTEAVQRRLDVTFRVVVARTDLTLGEWSEARVGDGVLFEGVPFPHESPVRPVQLACGKHQADARLSADGSLSITSPFEDFTAHGPSGAGLIAQKSGRVSMPTSAQDRSDARSQAAAVVAAAPIEVVAELGRITLPAAEVLALGPGSVLPLGWVRPESVELRVGNRTWATGELVDLDGQLGVRLTSIAAAPVHEARPAGDTEPLR